MRNLFIELHQCRVGDEENRFGTGWEDLFTEQLAFFLSCDPGATSMLAGMLLNEDGAEIDHVELQPGTDEGQPDLALRLTDGRVLFLEHKIDAVLQPQQLERYLRHGMVALVSRRSLVVSDAVLEHGGYLQPTRGEHYTWEDVFRAISNAGDPTAGQALLREAFLSYMRELGFAPSDLAKKWRRLFEDRTEKDNRRVQRECGRLLRGIQANLRNSYGLRVTTVSHKGKMARAPADATWRHLYVHPRRLRSEIVPGSIRRAFEPGFEALAIEVVYDEDQAVGARRLSASLPDTLDVPGGHRWYRIGVYPIGRNRLRVSVATPLAPLFRKNAGLEERLHGVTMGALNVVLDGLGMRPLPESGAHGSSS